MKRWRSHKVVDAAKIVEIPPSDRRNEIDLILDAGGGQCLHVVVTAEWHQKHGPEVGGYYVKYADGYESYSPAKAFEEGYTEVSDTKPVTTFRPLADRVLVRPTPDQDRTAAGIIIPDANKSRPRRGVVIAVGEGALNTHTGLRIPPRVRPGDRVVYGKYSGGELSLNGEELLVMREDEILGTEGEVAALDVGEPVICRKGGSGLAPVPCSLNDGHDGPCVPYPPNPARPSTTIPVISQHDDSAIGGPESGPVDPLAFGGIEKR